VHRGSSGSVKSLVDLEHFDVKWTAQWSDSVATIGQPRTLPQVGRADWLSAGKAVTKEIPYSSPLLNAVFIHNRKSYFTAV